MGLKRTTVTYSAKAQGHKLFGCPPLHPPRHTQICARHRHTLSLKQTGVQRQLPLDLGKPASQKNRLHI